MPQDPDTQDETEQKIGHEAPWTRGDLVGQCVIDTSGRTASGILIYVVLWLVVCGVAGLLQTETFFVILNALGLSVIAAIRLVFTAKLPVLVERSPHLAQKYLVSSVLLNGFYWGVLTAISVCRPVGEQIWWAMLLISVGMCAAGTVVMGINKAMRLTYPFAIISPILIGAFALPTNRNMLVAALSTVFIFYVIKASKVVYRDYWEALEGRVNAVAQARAFEVLSATDALTGLSNRRTFDSCLQTEWRRATRNGTTLAILMVDLDNFKRLNDTYGHPFGDVCLKSVASALRDAAQRAGDLVARYGGEEFVMLLAETTDEAAAAVAQKCLERIRAVVVKQGDSEVPLRCSIGIATRQPQAPDDPLALQQASDEALYRAKAAGKDRYSF
ncbi:MAG: GGDEF domain-containing protein [Rubrivivax sp.]|nr:MAG: GGDEF domain-containing protein [Rubrivivax sp.]